MFSSIIYLTIIILKKNYVVLLFCFQHVFINYVLSNINLKKKKKIENELRSESKTIKIDFITSVNFPSHLKTLFFINTSFVLKKYNE